MDLVEKMDEKTLENGPVYEKSALDSPSVESEVSYTETESKRVLRMIDRWIMPILCITYAIQYWDKVLVGQSVLFGLSRDLELTKVVGHSSNGKEITSSTRFSNVSWVFYLGYLFASYPTSYMTQRFPTAKVCAATIFLWGMIVMSTAACKNYSQLMVNRFFLGVCESAIAPTFTVYITFWWTRHEQAVRSAMWFGSVGLGMLLGPLISYGLGRIHGDLGSSWKYIFLVAGAIAVSWSLVVLWVLPDDPHRAKWLSDRDRVIILARLKADNSGAVNRKFVPAQFWEAITDYNLYVCAFFLLGIGIPNGAISTFSGLVIHGFGFDAFTSVLLMCPMGAVAIISASIMAYTTHRWKNMRFIMGAILYIPALLGSLIDWLSPRDQKVLLYIGIILLPSISGPTGMSTSIAGNNSAGHTKKATVSAFAFIGYCVGNIAGPLAFASTPGPKYMGGFVSSVVFLAALMVLCLFSRWYFARENARRDREYGPPIDELVLEDVTDRKNMNFRYII